MNCRAMQCSRSLVAGMADNRAASQPRVSRSSGTPGRKCCFNVMLVQLLCAVSSVLQDSTEEIWNSAASSLSADGHSKQGKARRRSRSCSACPTGA